MSADCPPRLGDLQHRAQRDERLARPDLALHEPVHRPVALEIARDLVADRRPGRACARTAATRRSARSSAPGARGASPTARGRTAAAAGARPAARTPRACAACCARWLDLLFEVGAVDALDRGARVEQPVGATELVGKRIGDRAEPVEHELDDLPHLPARDRARGGIDRDRQVRVRLRGRAARSARRRTARSRDARAASRRGTPPPCRRRRRADRAADPSAARTG